MSLFAKKVPATPTDPAAFDALYRSQVDWVARTFRRLGAREPDLEDLAHDLFVVVHRQLPSFDAARPLRPWLFGIAVRVMAAYRRRASHRRERPVAGPAMESVLESRADAPGLTADVAAEDGQLRDELLRALAELPLEQRAVFIAVAIDETPVPEVAHALGVPLNTCYSRLRLARQHLAATFTPSREERRR
ncbi:MAG: RNA polymerase sigma factor [Myxococcota bacterium]